MGSSRTDEQHPAPIAAAQGEEDRRHQAILDALPVPIFFKDRAGAYLGFNRAFEGFLGRSRAELLGKTVFDVAPRDLADVYHAADEALLAAGGPQVYESRVQWADGTRHDVVFHKAVLRDATGAAAGVVGAMLDVTTQREAERARNAALESARAAQRLAALGTLAAGVAQELTSPLTFVLANVEHAAESLRRLHPGAPGTDALAAASHALQDALEGAEQLRAILRDLRTLARDDDHTEDAADVRAILVHAAGLAQAEIAPRARLVWDVADVPPVRGGEIRLGQVLLTLLVNAAHATPEGRPADHVIRLSAALRPDGKVALAVADEGAGLPPERLARVFDPLFTSGPVGPGTGLGLWVCHSIVTAAGGALEVESEVGRGTTFRVLLPAAEGEPARGPRRDGSALPKVLVVDEEPLVAATLRRQLASEFWVEAASGPADALARVASGTYDAVICDLVLEGASRLSEAIRAARPALAGRLLFVSAGAPAHLEAQAARAGATVLAKPFGGRQLREALRELLRG